MARVRCPKCATVVEVAPGERPVCPSCGFGREDAPAAGPPPAAAQAPPAPAVPAAHAAQPHPAAPPEQSPWDGGGYGAPTAPGAARAGPHGGPPGTPRSPGLVVLWYILSYIVTLGAAPFYAYYWYWKTGDEMDRFRGDRFVGGVMRPAVILSIIGAALAFVSVIMLFGALGTVFDDIDEETDPEDLDLFGAAAVGSQIVSTLGGLVGLVGYVLVLVAMWRLWNAVAGEQRALGNARPLQPGMLLTFLLSPLIAVPVAIVLFFTIIGIILVPFVFIGVVVLLIMAYVQTQNALNEVWVAHGAQPA